MPVKKKKRKTKRKYHKKKVNKEQNLNWSVFGLVLLLIAVLALVRFGILGKQIANLIRLFFW